MRKKIYISGKIGEYPISAATKKKFADMEERLLNEGWDVFNPASEKNSVELVAHSKHEVYESMGLTSTPYRQVLVADIEILSLQDAIYMLPDWINSPGAKAEHAFAVACGIQIFYDDELFTNGTIRAESYKENRFPWELKKVLS